MRVTSLDPLFLPRSIAVIGESGREGGLVWSVVTRMVTSGYRGRVMPVVPGGEDVYGLQACDGVENLPKGVELAIMCLKLADLIPVLDELGRGGVKCVICLASGETETRADEFGLEQRVNALVRKWGMTLVGPKSLGLINTVQGVNASVCLPSVSPGNIAFFSQSDALTLSILDLARDELGFSKCMSLGNRSRISETDLLAFLVNDPDTAVIAGYMEAVGDAPRFLRTAQDVTKKKPVVVVRPGTTPKGQTAALFHRDAMFGFAKTYATVFKQTGIIATPDIPSFLALLKGFSKQPLPEGNNVAVVTNSGSFGVLAADAAATCGFDLPCFSRETMQGLGEMLPGHGGVYNPVVMEPTLSFRVWKRIIGKLEDDPLVHIVVVVVVPRYGMDIEELATSLVSSLVAVRKTVCVCVPGGPAALEARRIFESTSLPCYDNLEQALYTVRSMREYRQWQRKPYPVEVCYRRDSPKIRKIIDDARDAGMYELQGIEAQPLLMAYELTFWEMKLARTAKSAAKMARKMGFPVALKLASPQADMVGREQVVDVDDNKSVYEAFWEITEGVRRVWPEIFISGCLVQKTAPPTARRVCIRLMRDPQFGPLISFALDGGCDNDQAGIAHRLAPLSLQDAHDIIREPWAFPVLRGSRGEPGAHLRSLEDVLLTVSQLAMDCPEILELELSPVFVDDQQTVIGNARVVLSPRA
ncbi:acetate--CoA ligase family protein [Desulfoplanes formicivorans]|uniref:Acyl-CoA synthetase n=1 Tax=Desulfoplanes formicivorans TaxID=1592317 RepID=A0A194AFA8_9BACT|nr:acetate--CoA ligase [Desulfoplanes formicivorans]GAU08018.1 acyl-CoA synthetase [Desulfoplanes formicivorans]